MKIQDFMLKYQTLNHMMGKKYVVGDDNVAVCPLDVLDIEADMYTTHYNEVCLRLIKITHIEHSNKYQGVVDTYNIFGQVADEMLFDIKEIDKAFNNIIEKCNDSDNYALSRYKAKKIQKLLIL